MSDLDTSAVLPHLVMRITNATGGEWTESPWPGQLYHQDESGQVSPYSGNRYSLIPTTTTPMTDADGVHHRQRRTHRAVVSEVDLRWSATTPIDEGASPFQEVLVQERRLIDAVTEPDGQPMRVLWTRASRDVFGTGWVVGTLSFQVHHELEMR